VSLEEIHPLSKPGSLLVGSALPLNYSSSLLKAWLPVALFAVLWLDLVRQLSFQWSASEQYAYGWFVPLLAAGLFFRRWVSCPAPHPESAPLWMKGAALALALSLLPIRVVYEINPDWPLPGWLASFAVVGLSLYAVFLMGGRVWLFHFAFPICFILVAVRWPYRIEHSLTQGLMKVVAGLTVEALDWVNIQAEQVGNLIRVGPGVVGVDEACSGIRSFQATLMGALFMGELYRMRWPVRVLFAAGGVGLAFVFNVLRTFILTWRASTAGLAALEKWHDTAGFSIFLLSFLCLWAFAGLLARGKKSGVVIPNETAGLEGGSKWVMPRRYLAAAGCWMIAVLALTETWYETHEPKQAGLFHWSVRLPEGKPAFEKIELPPRTVALLACDDRAAGRWREQDGSVWTADFFRWKPRSVQSVIHARLHRPDVCLPAAGFEQVADSGVVCLPAGGLDLPFRRYIYEAQGQRLYVFFCQWEDGAEKQAGMAASKGADRLLSVLKGRRWLGQQTLEFVVLGCESLEKAEERLRNELPEIIAIERPKS
jgi:exosortase